MNTRDALRMAQLAIDSLGMIQGLTRHSGGGATAALASISHIVGTLQSGLDGKATPAEIATQLLELRERISDNDAAANAAVDAKFDK